MRPALMTTWLLLAAGATPAAAADPSLFETFKTICSDTHADPQKVAAALDASWKDAPVPAEMADRGVTLKVKTVEQGKWELVLSQQDFRAGENNHTPFATRMHMCMMSLSPSPQGSYEQVRAFLGGDPAAKTEQGWIWSFADAPAGRRFIAASADPKPELAKAPLVMVTVRDTPKGSGIGYMRIEKVGN